MEERGWLSFTVGCVPSLSSLSFMVGASRPRAPSLVVPAGGSPAHSARSGPDAGAVGCGISFQTRNELSCRLPVQLENCVKVFLVSPKVCYLLPIVRQQLLFYRKTGMNSGEKKQMEDFLEEQCG